MRSLKGLTVPPGSEWEELFTLFLALDNHNIMPDNEWYQAALEKISAIGKEVYIDHVVKWASNKMDDHEAYKGRMDEYWNKRFAEKHTGTMGSSLETALQQQATTPDWVNQVFKLDYTYDHNVNPLYTNSGYYFYYTLSGRLLRGILHTAALFPDTELMTMVDAFSRSHLHECMDVIHIYTRTLPADITLARILRIQGKIKDKPLLKKIEAVITKLGKSMNMSSDQMKEAMVPDFGLDPQHRILLSTGGYSVGLDLLQHKPADIVWWENGQKLAKPPTSAKKEADAVLKKLKADGKVLSEQLNIHRNRIENVYRQPQSWVFTAWLPLYITHPLIGALGKRLIWQFSKQEMQYAAIWTAQGFRTASGEILNWMDEETTVELWHPILADAAHVLQWRTYFTNNEIQQPFKQAFREVYLITDAEETTGTYSNRFASHILYKDQFAALCKVRGWTPSDMEYTGPNIKLPAWEMQANFSTRGIYLGAESKVRGSAHVTTDTVMFLRKKKIISLSEVPPIVFSEVMRDIDLYVGVTSIGNDPTWHDRSEEEGGRYWRNYAFGDLSVTAKIREEALRNLVPRLPIADKCRFEGKFLVVDGSFTTYKIHMGSGNILMAPNDSYLCIVPDGKGFANKVFLPFEGDSTLSIIVSKAILLANDKKITDSTILRQIKRN
ncbi:DUF4132 domain-containing protein [Chitinophaga agrisoli]|uniref:DUF4132 domain-containing protein n=1 Tax=Chitinophaga agrisoli TaxID=2607653 RepID=A0A5B2VXX4_9BACT|nr:DUF4132 domain-containing protein [Chitinophaga agrisoli]KAA2243172.1 DUF4132 domain-containing protein [Chitinophaga agrisoli]